MAPQRDAGSSLLALAAEIRVRADAFCPRLEQALEGIRATVVGASQYTVQLSGSTIFVSPLDTLPVRNVPVIAPALPLEGETIDSAAVSRAVAAMLRRLDLTDGEQPVAVFAPWSGSATFQRLDAFCKGVVDGLAPVLAQGHPVILAGDCDVGGRVAILRLEQRIAFDFLLQKGGEFEVRKLEQLDRLHQLRRHRSEERRGRERV